MNKAIVELINLANGSEACGDKLAATICRDAIVEIERLKAKYSSVQHFMADVRNVTRDRNPNGATILDFMAVWNEQYQDRHDRQEREIGELRCNLHSLLAIIHGDGGHHTEEVGEEQSAADAHAVWVDLQAFASTYCDAPADRFYHAEDQTWWKRVGNNWKAADPPPGWFHQAHIRPACVRMLKTVRSCPYLPGPPLVANRGKLYPCEVNPHGAVSVRLPGGSLLGVKPGEFEVIEWRKDSGR